MGPLRHGAGDPTIRFAADGVWRASLTPEGAVTVHLRRAGDDIRVEAWGPGARWAVDGADLLIGAGDDPAAFRPQHPVVARLHRSMPGLRVPRTRRVLDALVPAIIEQKVTSVEAHRSWRAMVRRYGQPAPGPVELLVAPSPPVLAALPYHAFHPLGVERRRAEVIRRAARHAPRLEEAAAMAPAAATARLRAIPGVGAWTAAEVTLVALGDLDAVSVGDYHLPHQVAWALAGERRADNGRMLELLEPFRGQRGRVVRLIELGTAGPPRRAPRARLRSFATW